ncbi:MAG: hypothetical protein RLZZ142_1125 [Verrucomicrobiota bacterium]
MLVGCPRERAGLAGGEEVGAYAAGFFHGLLAAPLGDGCMVAGEQDVRNPASLELHGTGVLGKFKETGGEGVVRGGGLVAENSGDEPDDGVDEYHGGDDAVGQDVVADGDFFVDEQVDDALVDALVVSAEENEVGAGGGEALGGGVFERGAAWGEQEDACVFSFQGLDGVKNGFALEDHALSAAVRGFVCDAVFVFGPVAKVVGVDGGEAAGLGFAEDAFAQGGRGDLGKKGEDIDAHGERGRGNQGASIWRKVRLMRGSRTRLDLGRQCSQWVWLGPDMSRRLPGSRRRERVCWVRRCLKENFRAAPKLREAMGARGWREDSSSLCQDMPSEPEW